MISRTLRQLITQPELVIDHIEGYAQLFNVEARSILSNAKMQIVWLSIMVMTGMLALVFTGISLISWGVYGAANLHAPGLLWLVPGVPALISVFSFSAFLSHKRRAPFSYLREQVAIDAALFHQKVNT